MFVSINIFSENGVDNIQVRKNNNVYVISALDLYNYLKDKETKSDNMIEQIKYTANDYSEPDDEFLKMNDEKLLKTVKTLLEYSKRQKIEKYYSENNIEYRQFNLRGLVFKNKITHESHRKIIRDICRKCDHFLCLIKEKNKSESRILSKEEKIQTPNKLEEKQIKSDDKEIEEKVESIKDNPEINQSINEHSKTCIREFVRGPLKGKICGKTSIMNQSYCELCISKFSKIRTNISCK